MSARLSGLAFPFRIEQGGVAPARGFAKVEQDMRHLLSTRVGERVMLRAYGGGVHRRVQDPNDPALRTLLKHEIEQAVRLYMPEVQLTAPIRVITREEELTVVIEYTANPADFARRLELKIP
jgi:phage baseplate assembly protein W